MVCGCKTVNADRIRKCEGGVRRSLGHCYAAVEDASLKDRRLDHHSRD